MLENTKNKDNIFNSFVFVGFCFLLVSFFYKMLSIKVTNYYSLYYNEIVPEWFCVFFLQATPNCVLNIDTMSLADLPVSGATLRLKLLPTCRNSTFSGYFVVPVFLTDLPFNTMVYPRQIESRRTHLRGDMLIHRSKQGIFEISPNFIHTMLIDKIGT